jgi:hypothetical protein
MFGGLEKDLALCPVDIFQSKRTDLATPHAVGVKQLHWRNLATAALRLERKFSGVAQPQGTVAVVVRKWEPRGRERSR